MNTRKLYAVPYGSTVKVDGHHYIHIPTRDTITATLRHTATGREYRKADLLIPYDTEVEIVYGPFDGWETTVEKLGRMPQESDVIPEMLFQDLRPGDTFSLDPSDVYDRCTKISSRKYEKREYSRRSTETASAKMKVYNVLMR